MEILVSDDDRYPKSWAVSKNLGKAEQIWTKDQGQSSCGRNVQQSSL